MIKDQRNYKSHPPMTKDEIFVLGFGLGIVVCVVLSAIGGAL